jgi:hypothetical protein
VRVSILGWADKLIPATQAATYLRSQGWESSKEDIDRLGREGKLPVIRSGKKGRLLTSLKAVRDMLSEAAGEDDVPLTPSPEPFDKPADPPSEKPESEFTKLIASLVETIVAEQLEPLNARLDKIEARLDKMEGVSTFKGNTTPMTLDDLVRRASGVELRLTLGEVSTPQDSQG